MYTLLLTALLSGAALAPAHEPFGSYGGFAGYDCPTPMPTALPPFCPGPGFPGFPVFEGIAIADDADPEMDAIWKAIKQLKKGQEETNALIEAIEAKTDERIKALTKSIDLQLMEQRLKNGLEALKEKEKVLEMTGRMQDLEVKVEDKLRQNRDAADQNFRRLEDKFRQGRDALERHFSQLEEKLVQIQGKKIEDPEARLMLRLLEEKLSQFHVILKGKLDLVESRVQGIFDKGQEDKSQSQLDKLESNINQLEKSALEFDRHVKKLDQRLHEVEIRTKPAKNKKTDNQGFQVPTNRALMVVNLPVDASLYVEGKRIEGKSNLRAFITPELEMGATYSFTLRVEMPYQGRTETQTRQVFFRAGNEIRVTFRPTESSQAEAAAANPTSAAGRKSQRFFGPWLT